MTDNEAQLERGFKLAKALQNARDEKDSAGILAVLNKLKDFEMSISILKKTELGLKLHEIRKDYPLASEIRNRWMKDFATAQNPKKRAADGPDSASKRMRDEVENKKAARKQKLQKEANRLASSMSKEQRDNITGREFMRKLERRLQKPEGYFDKEKSFIKDIGAVALQAAQKNNV